jgi:hypothetical protein
MGREDEVARFSLRESRRPTLQFGQDVHVQWDNSPGSSGGFRLADFHVLVEEIEL